MKVQIARATASGDACNRPWGPTIDTSWASVHVWTRESPTFLGIKRSSVACRYSTGAAIFRNCADRSTVAIDARRALSVAGLTDDTAWCSSSRNAGVQKRPNISAAMTAFGAQWIGSIGARNAHRRRAGRGLAAKLQHRINAMTRPGCCAAKATATGPENDSPRTTRSPSGGNWVCNSDCKAS